MSSQPASLVLAVPPAPEPKFLQTYLQQNLLRDVQIFSLAPEPVGASLDLQKTLQIGQLVCRMPSEAYPLAAALAPLLV